jgi:hypothetical protein
MKRLSMYNDLYVGLTNQLQQNDKEPDPVKRFAAGVAACACTFDVLYKQVIGNSFTGMDTEIQFFKEVKPFFESRLIYHKELYWLYNYRPAGGEQAFQKRLEKLLKRIRKFYKRHCDFITYYQEHQTYNDQRCFLRSQYDWRLHRDTHEPWNGTGFCTNYDHILAQLLAYEELEKYVQQLNNISAIEMPHTASQNHTFLQWTGQKTSFVELVYGLYLQGVFNHGKSTLAEIAGKLAAIFNFPPVNVYNIYSQICMRKTDRTRFLDKLRDDLNGKMDDDE